MAKTAIAIGARRRSSAAVRRIAAGAQVAG